MLLGLLKPAEEKQPVAAVEEAQFRGKTVDLATLITGFIFYCKTILLNTLRWYTGKVRDGFGGMSRFKGGLR